MSWLSKSGKPTSFLRGEENTRLPIKYKDTVTLNCDTSRTNNGPRFVPNPPTISSANQCIDIIHSDSKTPQQLLQTAPFNLVFRAEHGTDVKTDTLLSKDLTGNKESTLLSYLRVKGKLYVLVYPQSNFTTYHTTTIPRTT